MSILYFLGLEGIVYGDEDLVLSVGISLLDIPTDELTIDIYKGILVKGRETIEVRPSLLIYV